MPSTMDVYEYVQFRMVQSAPAWRAMKGNQQWPSSHFNRLCLCCESSRHNILTTANVANCNIKTYSVIFYHKSKSQYTTSFCSSFVVFYHGLILLEISVSFRVTSQSLRQSHINSSPPEPNGRHFGRRLFQMHLHRILIHTSLKFLVMGPIDNKATLVLVMA